MDVATFNDLPDELKQAALRSFIAFRDRFVHETGESKIELEEAIKNLEARKAKHDSNIANQGRYEELIRMVAPNMLESEKDKEAKKHQLAEDARLREEAAQALRRRIRYGAARPKEKLFELLSSSRYLRTDEELLQKLQKSLNIDSIPLKTVLNNLYELVSENAIKRYKSKDFDGFLNGMPEMFDENGVPKPEHLKSQLNPEQVINPEQY